MRGALLTIVALVMAGCLTPATSHRETVTGGEARAPPGPDDYWLVWVHGEESHDYGPLEGRVVCSIAFDHELDHANKTLTRANDSVPADEVRMAIVADHWQKESDCPLAYTVVFNEPKATFRLGAGGEVTVELLENGTLVVDGAYVPFGAQSSASYEKERDSGSFTVENLGGWPRAGIRSWRA